MNFRVPAVTRAGVRGPARAAGRLDVPRSWGYARTRWRGEHSRPVAVQGLALQREGALGPRLEGHSAPATLAPSGLARPARHVAHAADEGPGAGARRRGGDRGFDAHHRAPGSAPAGSAALPGEPPGAPARPRARGLLRRGARPTRTARVLLRGARLP